MTYVTDTHPLVWLLEGSPRLSKAARQALADSKRTHHCSRHRPGGDQAPLCPTADPDRRRGLLGHVAAAANSLIYPLDEAVVEHLPISLDIHDAIIVGTALVYRDVIGEETVVITRDAQIAASGLIQVLW
jgi:hypothetical protein